MQHWLLKHDRQLSKQTVAEYIKWLDTLEDSEVCEYYEVAYKNWKANHANPKSA